MRILRLPILIAVACLCLAPFARSQDSHYWTNQYGTRATLLGGAVIGSVLDLSGTYYNPGGMSLIKDPQTLMAAKIIQYPRVSLVGNDPGSVPFNSKNSGPAPSLIAGTFKLRGLGKHWFGYSYLSRQEIRLGLSVSSTGTRDVLPGVPGREQYATQFRLEERMSEPWFGLTWSYKLAKNVGVGVSQYIAVRTHRANLQTLVEALDSGNRVAMALGARQYRYQNIRILWKIGLACDFKWATMGLTLTTPGLSLFGTGSTGVNSSVAALDMNGDGVSDDFMAANYSNRLPVAFRTPFSLAAGMTVKIRKVRVYWSAEWFARVHPYTVIDAAEFTAQSTGELMSSDVTQELEAVLNMGIGLEWFYSARFKGYASFTTDYSAKKPGTATNISLTDWDIHNIMTGAEVTIKNTAVTFGFGYSFGNRELGGRPPILAREEPDGFWDPFESLKFRYSTYKLIVGFAF
jgi:hypothetical protein